MISANSAAHNGETDAQRAVREERNADRAQRRAEANAAATATNANPGVATYGDAAHNQGGHRVTRNLNEEFIQVDGHEVLLTPSTNLTIAMNELGRLAPSPELAKATAMLKAAVVQVNENRQNQAPSHSTSSNRSAGPRRARSQRPGGSRF